MGCGSEPGRHATRPVQATSVVPAIAVMTTVVMTTVVVLVLGASTVPIDYYVMVLTASR